MATRQIQVSDPIELMLLLLGKSGIIGSALNNAPDPLALDVAKIGREISRMTELHAALSEAIAAQRAALPKGQHAEGRRAS